MADPGFLDWLADKLGTRNWCVAQRYSDSLRRRGYTVAVSSARYARLKEQYKAEHPLPETVALRELLRRNDITVEQGAALQVALLAIDEKDWRA